MQGLAPADLPALRAAVPGKAIATCRASAEGGRFLGTEAQREALLRAAVLAGFDAVDLEADARLLRPLAAEAHRAGVELIVSRHHLGPASADHGLEGLFDATPPGAIAKYAAGVQGPGDLAALLRACALARDRGLRFAVMGLGDATLRLLAPLLGCELVYCAPPEGLGPAAAAGQVPAPAVQAVHDLLPRVAAVTGRHRLVVLLGDPVEHSLSPAMQNAAFAAHHDPLLYAAVRTPPARLRAVLAGLRAVEFAGANVTTPLKASVLPHLDRVEGLAREAAAVNTITVRRGKLVGDNTDGPGAVAALREAGSEPDGARALVLGAGGTGRAVVHALAAEGALVRVANRTPAKARALARAAGAEAVPWRRAALRDALAGATMLVNCTPVGRSGTSLPLPAEGLHEKLAVLDAVYRSGGTPLTAAARARGALALPGEALLLHQGALAYTLWTGKQAPVGLMRSALLQAQEELA
jgi:shikimate dehydrogenase